MDDFDWHIVGHVDLDGDSPAAQFAREHLGDFKAK
jgi:hypothetical protein